MHYLLKVNVKIEAVTNGYLFRSAHSLVVLIRQEDGHDRTQNDSRCSFVLFALETGPHYA